MSCNICDKYEAFFHLPNVYGIVFGTDFHLILNPTPFIIISDLNVINALLPITIGKGARCPQYEPKQLFVYSIGHCTILKRYQYQSQDQRLNSHCES